MRVPFKNDLQYLNSYLEDPSSHCVRRRSTASTTYLSLDCVSAFFRKESGWLVVGESRQPASQPPQPVPPPPLFTARHEIRRTRRRTTTHAYSPPDLITMRSNQATNVPGRN
ncbi:hypothetical protein RB195_000267 [Necator americanus]|uniref:Uncharacterized protein n=1 Tax=Necator americanus TaxID=51031 RepID=A0ABR1D901_NECAM